MKNMFSKSKPYIRVVYLLSNLDNEHTLVSFKANQKCCNTKQMSSVCIS